jgi:hypothetical protein
MSDLAIAFYFNRLEEKETEENGGIDKKMTHQSAARREGDIM